MNIHNLSLSQSFSPIHNIKTRLAAPHYNRAGVRFRQYFFYIFIVTVLARAVGIFRGCRLFVREYGLCVSGLRGRGRGALHSHPAGGVRNVHCEECLACNRSQSLSEKCLVWIVCVAHAPFSRSRLHLACTDSHFVLETRVSALTRISNRTSCLPIGYYLLFGDLKNS